MNNQPNPIQGNNISTHAETAIPIREIAEPGSLAEALNGPNGKAISVTFGIVTMSFFGLIAFGMLNGFVPSLKIGSMSLSFARC